MDSRSEQAFINGSPLNGTASHSSTRNVGVGDEQAIVSPPQQQYNFTFPIYHACAHSGNGRNRYIVHEQRANADGLMPQVKIDPPEDGLETVLQLTVAIRPRGMSNEQLKYHLQSCGIKADRLIPAGSVEAAMEQALESQQRPSEESATFMGEVPQQRAEPMGNNSEPIVWVEEEEFEPQMDRRRQQQTTAETAEDASQPFRLENPAEISLDDIDERQINRFGTPMVYRAKKRGRGRPPKLRLPDHYSDSEDSEDNDRHERSSNMADRSSSSRGYKNPNVREMRKGAPRFHQALSECRKRFQGRATYDEKLKVGCHKCHAKLMFKGSSMLQHIYKHAPEKLFPCPECSFSGLFSFMVIQHIREKHPLSDPYKFHDLRPRYDDILADLVHECYS